MRLRSITFTLPISALVIAACGSSGTPSAQDGQTLPPATLSTAERSDGFRRVQSLDEIDGIWVPVEIDGEPVDAGALGTYLQIDSKAGSRVFAGFDGCNNFGGGITPGKTAIDNGRFVNADIESNMMGCGESFAAEPNVGALLLINAEATTLLAEEMRYPTSISYERVDAIPVATRRPALFPEDPAELEEEAAQEAEEQAVREAQDAEQAAEFDRLLSELPAARALWAESGFASYTLRFELGALLLDPSFPQSRPVGGVWEIAVTDGVPEPDNGWAETVLGDTVEDWFAYVESQLDSHYLRVEFHPTLGYPTTIDSQPLNDLEVDDPNTVVAWIAFGEVVTV